MYFSDRIKETTTTAGAGAIILSGAAPGFLTFASCMESVVAKVNTGTIFCYCIVGQTGTEWECGLGRLVGGIIIMRDTILSSSNGDLIVTFSAGTKDIFNSIPADYLNKAPGIYAAGAQGYHLP